MVDLKLKGKKLWVTLLIVMAIALGLFVYFSSKNPYGDQLEVSNLDQLTKDLPQNKNILNSIKYSLNRIVSLNTGRDIGNNSIDDIVVRKGTFSQSYNEQKGIYTVKFIVDIASLKQSYSVSYQWPKTGNWSESQDEYGTGVFCLPPSSLIYGDFNCKDDQIVEMGVENYDPVSRLLPYHVPGSFKIVSYVKSGDAATTLDVEAYAKKWEIQPTEKSLARYEKQINTWLKSKKLNPEKYIINFIY